MIHQKAITIRTKKLGVLMRDARLAGEKTPAQVAEALGLPLQTYQAYEDGTHAPSLPELEAMAYYLNIPLDHFWGSKSLSEDPEYMTPTHLDKVIALRTRMVGALLRQSRMQAYLSPENLSEKLDISPAELEKLELGQTPIGLPLLEVICSVLDIPLQNFQDKKSVVGVWSQEQKMTTQFLELPPELQAFVCKPINRPYLELALRLSEVSVDKLRMIAEGLLEITY